MRDLLALVGIGLGIGSAVLAAITFLRRDRRLARVVVAMVATWALVELCILIVAAGWLVQDHGAGGPAGRATLLAGVLSEAINVACFAPAPLIALAVARRLLRAP